jgi:hypothetical protein
MRRGRAPSACAGGTGPNIDLGGTTSNGRRRTMRTGPPGRAAMPTRRLRLLVASVALLSAGCAGSRLGDPNEMAWTDDRTHPALVTGAKVRSRYLRYTCPCIEDVFVVHRGTFVKTFAELRPLVRPIDTPEAALAYRSLLSDVEIERDTTLEALEQTTPLDFYAAEKPVYGTYVASDAARWGVPDEPAIETTPDAIVITRPCYRLERHVTPGTDDWTVEEPRVELVRETFHRDGRYRREVVRVLERGDAARVHAPPLLC